jgi:putative ABC transport system substrate-binding protein
MNRREFITLLGGPVTTWPLAARAQQPAMPVIGFMSSRFADDSAYLVAGFRQGLREAGYVEGSNVAIEFRWAEGQYDRLPVIAAELAGRPVAVLVAVGGAQSALAARSVTTTVPIVFSIGDDPVKRGFVQSFSQPSGNMTGVSLLTTLLGAKRLNVLKDLIPTATAFAVLVDPNNPTTNEQTNEAQAAGDTLNVRMSVLKASSASEIDTVFATLVRLGINGLVVSPDPFFDTQRDRIITLAARQRIPAIYHLREFPAAGGLMSYGPSLADGYRQVGVYAAQILKGAKPADLPVLQPTKFDLVINLKTASTLGLSVPLTLQAAADEVIE